jgi:hypothetical protein
VPISAQRAIAAVARVAVRVDLARNRSGVARVAAPRVGPARSTRSSPSVVVCLVLQLLAVSHQQTQVTHSAKVYRCSSCARCFVALDDDRDEAALCPCGAPLVAGLVDSGRHEILSNSPRDAPVAEPEPAAPCEMPEPATPPAEADLGYGASHGYKQGHGGPSGPGDAPAVVATGERSSSW